MRGGLALATAVVAVGLSLQLSGPAQAQSLSRGKELAERLCAACHLNAGQGEKAGASGVPGFRAVANRPKQTPEDVVRWLKSVPPMMPDHHLSQDEIYDLAEFIMSLRTE